MRERILQLIKESPIFGSEIMDNIEKQTGKSISVSKTYSILEKLEREGIVTSYPGEPIPEREGKRRRYFKIKED